EVDLEALIGDELRLVGLDLTEVRMDGGINHERVVDDEFRIETRAAVERRLPICRTTGREVIDIAERSGECVRRQLNVSTRCGIGEAGERRLVCQAARLFVGGERPECSLAFTVDRALEDDT